MSAAVDKPKRQRKLAPMKAFDKNRGWLVLMEGGPSDGTYVRTYTQVPPPHWSTFAHFEIEADPHKSIERADPVVHVQMRYGNEAGACCQDPTGEYRLTAVDPPMTVSAGGIKVPASRYLWHPTE